MNEVMKTVSTESVMDTEADSTNELGSWTASRLKTRESVNRILVPLVFSEYSYAGVALACSGARTSGAEVILFHAVQLNIAGEERGIQRTRLLGELCRDAEARLKQLANVSDTPVTVEVAVCERTPAEAIIQTARRLKVDVIALGTRPSRPRLALLHRNTARRVIENAPCAVWQLSVAPATAKIHLTIVDRASSDANLNRSAHRENPNPFQSFLRVLFS